MKFEKEKVTKLKKYYTSFTFSVGINKVKSSTLNCIFKVMAFKVD